MPKGSPSILPFQRKRLRPGDDGGRASAGRNLAPEQAAHQRRQDGGRPQLEDAEPQAEHVLEQERLSDGYCTAHKRGQAGLPEQFLLRGGRRGRTCGRCRGGRRLKTCRGARLRWGMALASSALKASPMGCRTKTVPHTYFRATSWFATDASTALKKTDGLSESLSGLLATEYAVRPIWASCLRPVSAARAPRIPNCPFHYKSAFDRHLIVVIITVIVS